MTANWTKVAQRDLASIDAYYRGIGPDVADRISRAAIAAGRFLALAPAAGPVVHSDVRKWRIAGTPFLLLYRVSASGVEIVRVHHVRQDWQPRV